MNSNNQNNDFKLELCGEDQRALDALMDAGFDRKTAEGSARADRRRVDAVANLLGLLKDYPVEDAEPTLVHATLARIDRHEDEAAQRLSFEARLSRQGGDRAGRRIAVPNFITVAAVLLIGVSVLWPIITTMRQHSVDANCANNLRLMGYAFSNYAADNNDSMPMAIAGSSLSWDRFSNIVNLDPLVKGNYCEAGHLDCPGHAHHVAQGGHGGPSYSYRWFVPGSSTGWGTGPRITVVLGDLNPVMEAARSGNFIPPLSITINHAGRGQNVLANDGATMWLEQPLISGGDNIWLPKGADRLQTGERPMDVIDVFLAH
ncbi:MAG: hypothetical protein L0Y44_09350 [Phycisphaerales bacterium]|nr:hypothetical protein [Phycisphaerales bacterium]MCI0630844.1 hypothetical protein [Phycisphaerales bacterium]MCI0674656.1 hypothetical protein [Phycisphaerales bacterium]